LLAGEVVLFAWIVVRASRLHGAAETAAPQVVPPPSPA